MGVVIDTSVIIAAEKGKVDFSKLQQTDQAYITAITVTELLVGVECADTEARRIKRSAFIEHVISSVTVLPFDIEEGRVYARLLGSLLKERITIGTHDMIIAATAIAGGYPVLTMNSRDFIRIKGLEVLLVQNKKG